MSTQVDWAALKEEKSSGVSVADLAAKYNVSQPSIYYHLRNGSREKRHLNKVSLPSGNGRTSAGYAQVIADLIERRDKLNAAIAALEEVQEA